VNNIDKLIHEKGDKKRDKDINNLKIKLYREKNFRQYMKAINKNGKLQL